MPGDPRPGIVARGGAGWPVRGDQECEAPQDLAFRTGPNNASEMSSLMARGGSDRTHAAIATSAEIRPILTPKFAHVERLHLAHHSTTELVAVFDSGYRTAINLLSRILAIQSEATDTFRDPNRPSKLLEAGKEREFRFAADGPIEWQVR
jgi:hypothetical protein